jgi:hypothetical protein
MVTEDLREHLDELHRKCRIEHPPTLVDSLEAWRGLATEDRLRRAT